MHRRETSNAIEGPLNGPLPLPSRPSVMSKRVNIFSNFFSLSGSLTIIVLDTKRYGNITTKN